MKSAALLALWPCFQLGIWAIFDSWQLIHGEKFIYGLYGPYILHDKKYKALEKTDNILDIDLERAIELIAKPTIRGNATLKTFGEHPEERKEITAHDGKYGFYVKCGKINASLLGDQTIETLNLEEVIKLINDRMMNIFFLFFQKLKRQHQLPYQQ